MGRDKSGPYRVGGNSVILCMTTALFWMRGHSVKKGSELNRLLQIDCAEIILQWLDYQQELHMLQGKTYVTKKKIQIFYDDYAGTADSAHNVIDCEQDSSEITGTCYFCNAAATANPHTHLSLRL